MHQIQRYILKVLSSCVTARFSELRPPRTDSNLFSYHLKCLIRDGLVEKSEDGYRLAAKGLAYVDRVSYEKFEPRLQPKIITMTFVKNSSNELLVVQRTKQPFLGGWTPPSGKVHLDDVSIVDAVRREVYEKTGVWVENQKHRGDYYLRAYSGKVLISSVLCHVFTATSTNIYHGLRWVSEDELRQLQLVPGVSDILEDVLDLNKTHFFREIEVRN